MPIHFDLSIPHRVVAANSHYYKEPTEPLYLNRVLKYHDLIYLVNGGWAITENETEYPMEKDDVLLLCAGHHHYTRLPCLPETQTMCIHISCEAGDSAGGAVTLPTLLRIKNAPNVKRYFEEIISAMWSKQPYRQERLSALLALLIAELAAAHEDACKQYSAMAQQIISLINNTPHKLFKVSDVAQMFYVSNRTIENTMHNAVGMTFSKYQMNCKLEMVALQLEVEPHILLSEIAPVFGFCDEFHLSKAFKQKYGVSPTGYKMGKAK